MGICLFLISGFWISATLQAQDTARKKSIIITSTFKPALKNTAKLNFNADAPLIDTARPVLQYQSSGSISFPDLSTSRTESRCHLGRSIKNWNNDNYIKVGAGNVDLPYVQAGLSFGDRQHAFYNIFAEGYSSKGKLPFQENSLLAASISGTIKASNNLEWDGALGFRGEGYYLIWLPARHAAICKKPATTTVFHF